MILHWQEQALALLSVALLLPRNNSVLSRVSWAPATGQRNYLTHVRLHVQSTVQANIWQLRFHAAPSVLKDMHLDLATDENVLRHQITRSPDLPRIKQWRVLHHYGKKVDLEGLTKAELYYRETGRKLFRGVGADECRYCGQHGHKGDTCPNVSAEEQARMDQTESYAVSQSALSGQSLTQHKASGDAGDAEGPDDAARHEDADEADFERMVEDLDDGKTKQSNGQVEEAAQHADADEAELAAATAAPADDAGGGTGSSGAR